MFKKVGRGKKVYFSNNGAYIVSHGRRLGLDNFIRTNTPWAGHGYPDFIHGVTMSSFPLYLQLLDGGDRVQLWEAAYE